MTTEQIIHNKKLLADIGELTKAIEMVDSFASYWDAWGQELRQLRASMLAQLDPPYIIDDLQMVIPL